MIKERLDMLLLNKGLYSSRQQARAAIMAGEVMVNDHIIDKAGTLVFDDAKIKIKSKPPYVSRGGLKLAQAIAAFSLNLQGKTAMDIGASTGGFTDCMLQNGAAKVYAVDVGYGQLAWSIRCNQKVVVLEKTNARYLSNDTIKEKIDFVSIDVSFISLSKIFPVLPPLLQMPADIIALIKPQFEAGKDKVGKKGIIKDKNVHRETIVQVIKAAESNGLKPQGLIVSPLKGAGGNKEYLLWLKNNGKSLNLNIDI